MAAWLNEQAESSGCTSEVRTRSSPNRPYGARGAAAHCERIAEGAAPAPTADGRRRPLLQSGSVVAVVRRTPLSILAPPCRQPYTGPEGRQAPSRTVPPVRVEVSQLTGLHPSALDVLVRST